MKARGFTLLELVIVIVLIGITAVFGTRFIADMATGYTGNAERARALAGARFALERVKRELSLAYSPSVSLSDNNHCVAFVPVVASGRYNGTVRNQAATFILPRALQDTPVTEVNLAIRADSNDPQWEFYPDSLPANVAEMTDQDTARSGLDFGEAISGAVFAWEGAGNRYSLLKREQIRFCLDHKGVLSREQKTGANWSDKVPMLTGITPGAPFKEYDESLQLLTWELVLATRDGPLVLPSQIQVIYEP
jgi:MSHA biogenesis protein MshO